MLPRQPQSSALAKAGINHGWSFSSPKPMGHFLDWLSISAAKSDQLNESVGSCFPVFVYFLAFLVHQSNVPCPIPIVPSLGPPFPSALPYIDICNPHFRPVFLPRAKLSNSRTLAVCVFIWNVLLEPSVIYPRPLEATLSVVGARRP